MAENSKIEWTGRKLGAIKTAAKRLGLSFDVYAEKTRSGFRWCYGCKLFHPASDFFRDATRSDGLSRICSAAKIKKAREKYIQKPRSSKLGYRYAPVRDGDKLQARARVNHLVKIGILADPNSLQCIDCGHVSNEKERHEYDHHLGYSAENQEKVEPVCGKCHWKRGKLRGEIDQKRDINGKYVSKDHG